MTVLRSGLATDVGRVRTTNEDRAITTLTLYAVADGMGGHAGGEVAASIAVSTLQSTFDKQSTSHGLVRAVRDANLAVWQRSQVDADLRGMGTTLTAAALVGTNGGDRLALVNVGDSRTYLLRKGEFVQLTSDHSVAEELMNRGELTPAEAAIHPHRHVLTRALGISPDVDIDAWEITPQESDRFLLCSDGLCNEVPDGQLAEALGTIQDPQHAADSLVRSAVANGGSDNVTVLVLDVLVADEMDATDVRTALQEVGVRAAGITQMEVNADVTGGSPKTQIPIAETNLATNTARAAHPESTRLPTGVLADATSALSVLPAAPTLDQAALSQHPPRPSDLVISSSSRSSNPVSVVPPVRMDRGRHAPVLAVSRRRHRLVTFRTLFFVVLLAAVVAAPWMLIRWYVSDSYFVGVRAGDIVIYQGRPGGFLWFHPSVVDHTHVSVGQVAQYQVPALNAGVEEPSLAGARAYVTNLLQQEASLQPIQPTPSTSTTTSLSANGPGSNVGQAV